jgi:hypothetical protein
MLAELEEHLAHLGDLRPATSVIVPGLAGFESAVVDVDRAGVTDPVNDKALAHVMILPERSSRKAVLFQGDG